MDSAGSDNGAAAEVAVRPYGNALPLGFFSFGIGMVLLAGIGVGLLSGQEVRVAGILLAAFAIMLVPLAVVGFMGKMLLGMVLSVSSLRAALSAAYQLGAPHAVQLANAAAAFALLALSLYAGTAFLVEDLRQRTVLPILRRGPARRALSAGLADQYSRVPQEPGVRQQL